jgi:hypothetical protein
MKSKTMERQTIGAKAVYLLIAFLTSVSAQAGTVGIAYSFAGASSSPPLQSGTNPMVDNFGTGSVLSGNPSLDVGSGAETVAAVKLPLPDSVNPVATPRPAPETDPLTPANSPVPPVKIYVFALMFVGLLVVAWLCRQ